MRKLIKNLPNSNPNIIRKRLYLQTSFVGLLLLVMILVSVWTRGTLTMITAIARFERTHTVSRLEAKVSLLEYLDTRNDQAKEIFYEKMAITQSYNKVFSNLLTMRFTTSKKEFIQILESTFKEADHRTAVIIANRIKVLYWHPIIKELVGYAYSANPLGETIVALASSAMATNKKELQQSILQEILKTESDFIFYERSFSNRCSDLSNEIASFVDYFSVAVLILTVGLTSLITYLLANSLLQQASKHARDLEESKERLNLAVKGSNDAPWDLDLVRNEIYYSPQWWSQLGFEANELPADAGLWEKIIHPEDSDYFESVFGGALKSEIDSYEVEFRLLHKAGYYVPVLSRGIITRDRTGKPVRVTGTNMDLTSRKIAEEALKEQTNFLNQIIESSALSMWISDEKGTAIRTNPACLEFFGATEEEVVGKYNLFKDIVIEKKGFMPVVKNIFKTGKPASFVMDYDFGEVDHVDVKNATHKIIKTVLTPVIDTNKKVSNVIVQTIDLTEIKQSEEEKIRINKILAEHEKLSLIGQVAGKMAHDFNNVLGIIMGNTELSLLDCKDTETQKTLELIYEQTIRGKNLTKNLVAFAKDQEPKQEFFRINEKIDIVTNLLKRDLEGIELIKENKTGVPELLADPGMIEHALVNLIQNSIHATSRVEYPLIIIRTYCLKNDIYFEIEDNGCGIPEEYLETIFEPSFTLKGNRDLTNSYEGTIRGTGYGMSNVKKYIELHKGTITVVSKIDSGTKFTISLPAINKELTNEEKVEIKKEILCFEKYILLVEDETALSDIQYNILTQEPGNHKVDIANNGIVAIDLFDRNEYDFISLDYILPGKISGMDVYTHIRNVNPTIPILFVSGNIEFLESIKNLKQKDENVDHQSKPCPNTDYLKSINKLLESSIAVK